MTHISIEMEELKLISDVLQQIVNEFHAEDVFLSNIRVVGGFSKVILCAVSVTDDGVDTKGWLVCGDVPTLIRESSSDEPTIILDEYVLDCKRWINDIRSGHKSQIPLDSEDITAEGETEATRILESKLQYVNENRESIAYAYLAE
jgi:hypothetical protein